MASNLPESSCPSFRAFVADINGVVTDIGVSNPTYQDPEYVVKPWGKAEASSNRSVLALATPSFAPLLAVARQNGQIDMLSRDDGNVRYSIRSPIGAAIGLHVFPAGPGRITLFVCDKKGRATLTTFKVPESQNRAVEVPESQNRAVAKLHANLRKRKPHGEVFCCKVDELNQRAVYGGKGVPVNIWDLLHQKRIWRAESTTSWITAASFQKEKMKKQLVVGTNDQEVLLYDISTTRRPVMACHFQQSSIKALCEDPNGYTIYIGNAVGDLGAIDLRYGKTTYFNAKCCGSITSISRHCSLPHIAVCGFDSYLRIWDTSSRNILHQAFLDNHLTCTLFDTEVVAEGSSAELVLPDKYLIKKSSRTEKRKRLRHTSMGHRLRHPFMWSQTKSKSRRSKKAEKT